METIIDAQKIMGNPPDPLTNIFSEKLEEVDKQSKSK